MLSLILFALGIWLSSRPYLKVEFLGLEAEGQRVKTAGRMLMLPLAMSIPLGLILGASVGGDMQRLVAMVNTLAIIELAANILVVLIAYTLLRRSATAETMYSPGAYTSRPPTGGIFPSVMTTQQAATYLNLSEEHILEAIDKGELPAARINSRYNIARRALDEYKETHPII